LNFGARLPFVGSAWRTSHSSFALPLAIEGTTYNKQQQQLTVRPKAASATNTMSDAQQQQPLAVKQSLQGSRVKQELEALREKQLAKNQRDKFKDRTWLCFSVLPSLLCSRFAFFRCRSLR
jgi:hypothetical protein